MLAIKIKVKQIKMISSGSSMPEAIERVNKALEENPGWVVVAFMETSTIIGEPL